MKKTLFLLAFLPAFPGLQAQDLAQQSLEIGVEEKLNNTIPLDVFLFNIEGDTVYLRDIYDKPTILNFVYYRCPGICSPLMDGLADVIDKSELVIGEDYQAITISFDPRESSMLAERKKNNYLNLMEKKEQAEKGWTFYTGDSVNIAKLTDAVGFRYKAVGNDFIHSATLVITSPNGKITRYMNGIYFLPFELKMSIIDANEGKAGPTINKVLQYCYAYDPEGQEYVLNITKITGTLMIFIALIVFLVLILKKRKKTT
ncbi:MAG: SCO family protein [Bacteroidales bacterium]|nr:SCO family protein [Bacteroidales bacterium]MDT8431951.1 SCO family protein [Bacteroidales bacterium]